MFLNVGIFLTLAVALGTALVSENFKEGSCSGVPLSPIKANRDWVNSLDYISAGSKYHLYRLVSSSPNYRSMREDQFYYDSCITRNTSGVSSTNSMAGIFGFGRLLVTYDVVPRPGIYFEALDRNPSSSWKPERDVLTVTQTDNKSYAFIVICRTKTDQRGWVLVTNTPNLDSKAQRRIEDHAASLGFRRENFIFLRYDSCRWGNPLLDHGKELGREGKQLQLNQAGSGWTA